ncbi:Spherulation-specific family 4-domain-containing protein, partial [Mycena capillaripes]
VLLPLYVYPSSNCSAWSPVIAAISVHLTTTFYIIVNPDNGPGSGGSQPDENYVACIPHIRPSGSQVVVLGYVDSSTPSPAPLTDIDTYAGWDSSYRPTGIFLDLVSPTVNLVSTYQSYVSHGTSKGFTFVIVFLYSPVSANLLPPDGLSLVDPGEPVSAAYYQMVDLVNTYEDSYSSFDPTSLAGTISKQSVTLVDAPSTGSYIPVISQLQRLGVKAVYISNVPDSDPDLPVQLSKFVSEVASAMGVRGFPED